MPMHELLSDVNNKEFSGSGIKFCFDDGQCAPVLQTLKLPI
jgi:hypothetical protein